MLTRPVVARQVNIPLWALVHFPVIVTITTAMFTPKVRRPRPPLHHPDSPARVPPWQPRGAGRVLAGRAYGARRCRGPAAQTDGGARARQGWLHCILYVLFENAMGIVKLWACVAGEPPPAPPSRLQRRCRACLAPHAAPLGDLRHHLAPAAQWSPAVARQKSGSRQRVELGRA